MTPKTAVKITGWAAGGLLTFIAAMLIVSGFYQIKPGEATAVQSFGAAKQEPVTSEGLHWHWPWPIGKTTTEQVQKSRTTEVGFQTLHGDLVDMLTGENWQRDYEAATMITGDLGLLETQLVAHYYISDLNAYLFQADDPGVVFNYPDGNRERTHRSHPREKPDGQTIKDALEISVRRAVGQRTIDRALIAERESVEQETMEQAQEILNTYRTGLTITSVQLQEVKPPDEVQAAFDDVLQAREEKDTRINDALAFESKTLPEARGEAERIRKEAVAYRAQKVNAAEAAAARFKAILAEYEASPAIIAKRMHLETMDQVLPRVKQILVAGPEPTTIILNTGDSRNTVLPVPKADD